MSSPVEFSAGQIISGEDVAQNPSLPAIEQTFLSGKLAQLLCDRYENSKLMIDEGQSWTEAVSDFIPFIDAYARDDDHEDLARGLLARLFERSYRADLADEKSIEDFTFGVLEVLSQLRHVPDALMRPRAKSLAKRQPSFFESMMATIKRYKFMSQLPGTFDGMADGIIVGGSMGYGPFFSVRDNGIGDSSDIDAIVVIDEDFGSERSMEALLRSDQVNNADKVSLLGRISTYNSLKAAGRAEVISQRFNARGQSFNMSAHFFPADTFESMNGGGLQTALSGKDFVHVVQDFKPRKFEHPVCNQYSFDGSIYSYEVPEQEKLDDGYVARIPGYIINGGKLYPGLYQNLISPEFEVLSDKSGFTTEVVDHFRRIVLQYVDNERRNGRTARIDYSHIRNALFAPGRYNHRKNFELAQDDSK